MELRPTEEQAQQLIASEVSEDGSTWTVTATAGAHGEYDPEKQLTPGQIIEMKDRLNNRHSLLPEVCTHIVMNMLLESERETQMDRERVEANNGSFATNIEYETREDFAGHVGYLSALWAQGLQRAISLPGSEWPVSMTPPATFAEAIKDMERAEKEESMAKDVAGWLIDNFNAQVNGLENPVADEVELTLNLDPSDEDAICTMLNIQELSEVVPDAKPKFELTEFGDMVLRACHEFRENPWLWRDNK